MDFRDRHVIVTGGAGALGTAVVAALIEAGAICHVPCVNEAEAARFRLRDHKQVSVTVTGSLAEEAAIDRFYRGSRRSGRRSTSPAALPPRRCAIPTDATIRQQIDMNLVELHAVLPRRRSRMAAAAAASLMSPRVRRWNGGPAPA